MYTHCSLHLTACQQHICLATYVHAQLPSGATIPNTSIACHFSCSCPQTRGHPPSVSQTCPGPNSVATVPSVVVSLLTKFERSLRAEVNARLLALEGEILRLSTSLHKFEKQRPSHNSRTTSRQSPCPALRQDPVLGNQGAISTSATPRSIPSNADPHIVASRSNRSNSSLPFRIVWGTTRCCPSQVIKKVVCALLPRSMWDALTVKSSHQRRGSWWLWQYTLIAPMDVITNVDQAWHLLEPRTGWSLRTSLTTLSQHTLQPPVLQSQTCVSLSAAPQ